jgi:triose/dihydroxyacetone kinase / FAD-AMP lyase (cyclizing)
MNRRTGEWWPWLQVAGAAAARGLPLRDVKALADRAAAATATMGAALTVCTLPGSVARTESRLPPGTMELGLGIHGEPGAHRCALLSASATVKALLERILAAKSREKGERVALLVNNLGSTTLMELHIVARCALLQLAGVYHTLTCVELTPNIVGAS